MEWKVIAALTLLLVAIVVGFVIVLYTSVSRYARTFDPASAPLDESTGTRRRLTQGGRG